MRAFAQKQNQAQKPASSSLARPRKTILGPHHHEHHILLLQRAIGNQAVQRRLEANTVNVEGDSTTTKIARFGHDFSRIPVYAKVPMKTQTKLTVKTPEDVYEQEADRIADRVMATAAHSVVIGAPPGIQRFGYGFSRLRVHSGIGTAPGELDHPPLRISARIPTTLPAATPAWTRNGEINLGPAGLFMPPREQLRMLRHEAFHRLHQRIAPVSDAPEARLRAERLATQAETGAALLPVALPPAPALLAFPPQKYTPWDRVWIGNDAIIGEVTEGGVAARIFLSYKDLGITKAPESQTYHCGKHDPAPIPTLVKRMRAAAKQAAVLNGKITDSTYSLRTSVIAISKGANSAFRVFGGQGVLVIKQEDSWEGTIAHEGSHGIFAFHLGDRVPKGAPDLLAKGVAELFLELQNTAPVSLPSAPFDAKHLPPLKDDGKTTTHPAGLVMVADTLWAGGGGHPWDNADEFFASAFGMYQQKSLFDQIVRHYGKADPKIPPLAKKLSALLAAVGDPKAVAGLKVPSSTKAVDAELKRIQPTPEVVAGLDASVDLLLDPTTLRGPQTILCPGAKPPTAGTGAASQKATGP